MPVRFNVWFDDGATDPCWVVTALTEADLDHSVTGQYDSFWTKEEIKNYAFTRGVNPEELSFE